MGQGALSKPVVQWWLSLNSSIRRIDCFRAVPACATTVSVKWRLRTSATRCARCLRLAPSHAGRATSSRSMFASAPSAGTRSK